MTFEDEDEGEKTKHLAKSIHFPTGDVSETWCGQWDHGEETRNIDECDCAECLKKAIVYGVECSARLVFLQSEQVSSLKMARKDRS